MTFVHGKDAVFSLDDGGGVLRNVKIYLNTVTGLPGARGLSETTAFGDQGVRNIPGLANNTFSIAGHFDSTATTGIATVLNSLRAATATATFEYGPEGSTASDIKYTGECWMTELTVDASVSDRVPIAATFQVDGVVTVTAY
jgi:hypothetical protein